MDSIHASRGRVLTRAKTTSVIVGDERAEGVTVVRESGGGGNGSAAAAVDVMITGDGLGSVISSIGVIDTFRGLLPRKSALATAASGGTTAAAGGGEAAGAAGGSVTTLGQKDGEGLDPAGFRILRAARPRVHLCVGLQGNWLEDLDGTSSYVHHVSGWVAAVRRAWFCGERACLVVCRRQRLGALVAGERQGASHAMDE